MTNAMKASIKHWKDNVKRLKNIDAMGVMIETNSFTHYWQNKISRTFKPIWFDSEHCELCNTYWDFNAKPCKRCPLFKARYGCNMKNSPWAKCLNAIGNANIIKAAEHMLATLVKISKTK